MTIHFRSVLILLTALFALNAETTTDTARTDSLPVVDTNTATITAEQIRALKVENALSTCRYALLFDYAIQNGKRFDVKPNFNFLLIDSARGVLQVGQPEMRSGMNGLGGITLDGPVTLIRQKQGTDCTYLTFTHSTFARALTYRITVWNNGRASMKLTEHRFTLYGKLLPLEEALLIVGRVY